MAQIARTDTFWIALLFWLFGLLVLPTYLFVGAGAFDPVELIVDGVAAIALTWLLVARVGVVQRMRYKMASWGLGIAQLTLFAYLLVMPVYFLICLVDRE